MEVVCGVSSVFDSKGLENISTEEILEALREVKKIKKSESNKKTVCRRTGQGAQFIYAAATVANILCDSLSEEQINLLANFLAVVTTCAYAILRVEHPADISDEEFIEE